MANKLIPDSEFQTAVPAENGLLTLRSTNTESTSNNDLLGTYDLIIAVLPPSVVHEVLPPNTELIISPTPIETITTTLLPHIIHESLSPDSILITASLPVEDIPVLFYSQGTCFDNLSSDALITDKEELFLYLCEVLIRFDESPLHYQKEDFEVLIKTIAGSLIYLYNQDSITTKSIASAPFLGIAALDTDPLTFAQDNNYAFPGVYFAQQLGTYSFFEITVTPSDIESSVVLLVPNIINGIFLNYRKEIYAINVTGTSSTSSYKDEKMIGLVDSLNTVFETSHPFVLESLLVFLNGIKEKNYIINSNTQITFKNAPLNRGFQDLVEAYYVAV
ncbi:MAG: hypothetical protein ACOH2V_00180 [Candidatus Saccharimonadaceae bacterium]